jgi:hypothetical protein
MNDGITYKEYRKTFDPTPRPVKSALVYAADEAKNFERRILNDLRYEVAGNLAGQAGAFSRTHENYSRRQYELLKSGLEHYLSPPIKYAITNMRLPKPVTRSPLNQLAGGRTRRNRGRKIERTRRRRRVY